jgi:hypothetical protein
MSVQKLPAPRPVLWPLRMQDSARVSRSDDGGRRIITIEHAPLTGVTAEMLTWWYGHVPGTMPYADGMYPRYLVWHPLDHISYQVENNGAVVGAGSRLHIVEALGRDLDSVLDIHVTVARVDDTLPGWLMLNRVARARALPPRKLEKWIRHHIEEIGNLEHFLPTLFDEYAPVEA